VSSELTTWYEHYIEVFNSGDHEAFGALFHPPVTVVHASRYDERRAGRALPVMTEATSLGGPLPDPWARSTIDSVSALTEVATFAPRVGLDVRDEAREGIIATVTRWDRDDRPYQQVQAMYLLTREDGKLGIKVLVELGVADLPRSG
jgi:hypothetical protein